MEQLNYPIKYAVLGIEEQVGWVPGWHNEEREYAICGYIVSKVYVVGELISYNCDDTYTKKYQVVFPFNYLTDRERQIPKYNAYGKCYNSINVPQIFDSIEEAKQFANQLNKDLREKCYLPVSFGIGMTWGERVIKGQEEFDKRIPKYLDFEKFISKETSDMEITPDERMKSRIRKL